MKLNKMKNKMVLMGIALMMFVLSCGGTKKNDNVLKVGMECGYAPFNWFQNDDKNGAVKTDAGYCGGYDVEIAKLIAAGLGKELQIVKTDWDALLGPAITSGKVDLVIAGMTATPERKQSLTFSKSYYDSDLVVVVAKNSKYATAKNIQDLSGARLTGQLNTLHYTVIDQIKGVSKQTAMENFPAMIVALNSNKIDGYVSERPAAMAAQLTNPNLTYIIFNKESGFQYETDEVSVSIGMKLGDTELENKVNGILNGISKEQRQQIMETAIKNQPSEQ